MNIPAIENTSRLRVISCMNELYIEPRRRSLIHKRNGRRQAPAISMGCRGGNLEYELQTELELPGALRSGNPTQRTAAGIKRPVRRAAAESPDGAIEGVESV